MQPPRGRSPRLLLASGLLAILAAVSPASAQGPANEPPAKPVVTMPVVKTNEGAVYPPQALAEGFHEPAEVALLLTIDPSGAVSDARVETPVGHGFDEAAITAARALAFEPATRDGKPVAAKIRFVYRFAPPPAALAGRVVAPRAQRDVPLAGATVVVRDASGQERQATTADDGTWRIDGLPGGTYHITASAPGRVPHEADETVKPGEEASVVDRLEPEAPAPLVLGPEAGADAGEVAPEIEVRGERPPREVTKRTLEQREINRIPGTNGDALRSLQNLPGVARPPAFAGLLIVRGSAPNDTQYFVDGTPVPIIYHFGGLSSVVPTEMLNRIDFYPGNFSTQYGRAMGGIVDVGLSAPKKDRLQGFVQADVLDVRALVQGPVFDTGWTFALAGRRSWVDLSLAPALEAVSAGASVAPVYYDYQAILERDIGKQSNVRFAFFGSDDRLALIFKNSSGMNPELTGFSTHTGFWRGQALYRTRLGDQTELRLNAAFGEDYQELNLGNLFFKLTDWPITSRVELAQKLTKKLTMNVGLDVAYAPYTADALFPPVPKPGQPPPGPFGSTMPLFAHVDDSFYEPAAYAEWEATPWPGTRLVPGLRLDYARTTRSWDLSPRLVVRQDVARSPRTTIKAGAGLFAQPASPQQANSVFGTPNLMSQRAYHYDLGVEHEFTSHVEGSIEGFYKKLDRLVSQGLGNTGNGQIYGAEVLLRYKPDERFFGWLAYTLSRSERRDAPGMPLGLSQYDETHILTVLGSYRLGAGWEFGARFRLTSGYMYTPNNYGFYDENVGTYLALVSQPPFTSRLPLFHSLDLRVDKTWKFAWGKLGMYLDVLNVYDNANPAGISYDYNFTHTSYANDLPILPSFGVRVE
ncbi:MAG: TonB family protein, partial [Myxococcales bacterium]|nr:TonB family protein [Myxococcales bacterium]